MTTESPTPNTPDIEADGSGDSVNSENESSTSVADPEFQELANQSGDEVSSTSLDCFHELKVTVSADLGRTEIPIHDLMKLGPGAVLELDRTIDSPVELVAQGVTLASGEVVVVDGYFAVRITEVYQEKPKVGVQI